MEDKISFDEFKKLDLRVGEIIDEKSIEKIKQKFMVDAKKILKEKNYFIGNSDYAAKTCSLAPEMWINTFFCDKSSNDCASKSPSFLNLLSAVA